MSKEKPIEEMARGMCHLSAECKTCQICNERYHGDDDLCYFQCVAKEIINHGYRKQSEGKWIWINQATGYLEPPYGDTCKCSLCEFVIDVSESNYKYCPNCGAHMKGGAG